MAKPSSNGMESHSMLPGTNNASITNNAERLTGQNESRLINALEMAEEAMRADAARWDEREASFRNGKHSRASRWQRTHHVEKKASIRKFLKRHSRLVSKALLCYKRGVDESTGQLFEVGTPLNESVIERAQRFLCRWRNSLEKHDQVHCPDYIDEFEFRDEKRGFVKYYAASVIETALQGTTIPIGDTAEELDSRPRRVLGVGEKAVCVCFTGYHTIRWIMLSPPEPAALHLVPTNAQLTTVEALRKLHPEQVTEDVAPIQVENRLDPPAVRSDNKPRNRQRQPPVEEPRRVNGNKNESYVSSLPKARKRSRGALERTVECTKLTSEENTNQHITSDLSAQTRNLGVKPEPTRNAERATNLMVSKRSPKHRKQMGSLADTCNSKNTDSRLGIAQGLEHAVNQSTLNSEPSEPDTNVKTESLSTRTRRLKSTKQAPVNAKTNSRSRKKESQDDAEREEFTWICTECKESECQQDNDSPLLLCEGPCNRPFHYPCAGLATLPPPDSKWICNDCIRGQHQCVACQQFGEDNYDVFCCSKPKCGRFFHESCLTMYNVEVELVDVEVTNQEDQTGDGIGSSQSVSRPRFKCPAHQCWTCTEEFVPTDEPEKKDQAKKRGGRGRRKKSTSSLASSFASKSGRVYPCLECPIAYHSSCIPPLARFHELALLCHEHANTSRLPELDVESSYQGKVEAHADMKLEAIEKGKKRAAERRYKRAAGFGANAFFSGMRGDVMTNEEDTLRARLEEETAEEAAPVTWSFCLPCDYKKEVHSKPPSYRHVHSLRYNKAGRPKRRPPNGEACRCTSTCDEHCLNRMVMMECVGDPTRSSGEKNPYWNCNLGPACSNRNLGLRNFAKCRPQREQGKGWGLVSINGVKKGELVQEYTGEVIDEQTKKERLEAWARDHPNDPNYYVMYLDTGWYIDARNEANMSRFINHSCDPNCRLVRVNVGGYMHVAIYCCRDVAPGEFLSYDYQFDTKHGDKFVCRCGAPNCRGTLAGRDASLEDETEKKTKKQVRLEAKVRFDRDKKFLEEIQQSEAERLWQVRSIVPGATSKDGTETVASGPQWRYREVALRNRLFLWRTVVPGANFAARDASLERPKPPKRKHACIRGAVDVISLIRNQR